MKETTIKSICEPESIIYLRFVFSPISLPDSYEKIVVLVYKEDGGLQRLIFHFLYDEKDIRKSVHGTSSIECRKKGDVMEEALGGFLGEVAASRMVERYGGKFEELLGALDYLFS